MTPDGYQKLREDVARLLFELGVGDWDGAGPRVAEMFRERADAAIALIRPAVLREAAGVARNYDANRMSYRSDGSLGQSTGGHSIAKAILSLLSPDAEKLTPYEAYQRGLAKGREEAERLLDGEHARGYRDGWLKAEARIRQLEEALRPWDQYNAACDALKEKAAETDPTA